MAVNAPGPLIVLRTVNLSHVSPVEKIVTTHYSEILENRDVTCLLLNKPLTTNFIDSTYLGTEQLAVNLPPNSPLATRSSLTFADLRGQNILSPRGIGFWEQIYQDQIPHAHSLYQRNAPDYSKLVNYSVIPYFTTNLTALDANWGRDLPPQPGDDPVDRSSCQTKVLRLLPEDESTAAAAANPTTARALVAS